MLELTTGRSLAAATIKWRKCLKRILTLLIYAFVLTGLPLLALCSLITGRYVEGLYQYIPVSSERLNENERLGLALVAVHFLEISQPADEMIELLAVQQWPNGEELYSADELSHMVDVKVRIDFARILMWFSGLGLMGVWLWTHLNESYRLHFWHGLQNASAFMVMVSLGMMLIVLLLWPLVNIYFHAALFGGMEGNWQFPAGSGLITLFPPEFWFGVAISWVSRTIFLGTVLVFFGGFVRYRLKVLAAAATRETYPQMTTQRTAIS